MKEKKRKEEMGKRKNKNEFWLPKVRFYLIGSQMKMLLKIVSIGKWICIIHSPN
jgi:hypothetical protein